MPCKTVTLGNVYLVRWEAPEASDVHRVAAEVAALHVRSGMRVVFIAIAPETMDEPNPLARYAFTAAAKTFIEDVQVNVLVLEGRGVKRSLLRALATAVYLVSGDRKRALVYDNLDDALAYSQSYASEPLPAILSRARGSGLL